MEVSVGRRGHLRHWRIVTPPIEIVPATAELWPALADLFQQGGDPKRCWCMYWRVHGGDWAAFTAARNRALLADLVQRGERPPGLVALDPEGRAVGWVSVAPREDYDRLERSRVLARVDERPAWSVVCFVVARAMRRMGVARTLLDAAAAYAREHGAELLEAYPIATGGKRARAAWLYTGTTSMFEAAGFECVATRQAPGAARARHIYRRQLR